jgi:hypothetical protein
MLYVKMQDLTSVIIVMIYLRIWQSYAIQLQLLGELANLNLKHTCLSIHYYNKMERGPRTLQSSNLNTPQDDNVTSSHSARRRAKS